MNPVLSHALTAALAFFCAVYVTRLHVDVEVLTVPFSKPNYSKSIPAREGNDRRVVEDIVKLQTRFDAERDNGSMEWTGGLVQDLHELPTNKALLEVLEKTYAHMTALGNEMLKKECKNQHKLCAFWSAIGECDKNPSYMKTSCAPSCQTCELMLYENRCPTPEGHAETAAYAPGDIDKIFGKIKNGDFDIYGPVNILNDEPTVVTFDNFLTHEECDTLIELGRESGYERSTNTGVQDAFGRHKREVSHTRTSENAWCIDECEEHPVTKAVMQRIADITGNGIGDTDYQEHLQLLKYEVGQFYRRHHDFIDKHLEFNIGPRVFTFFLYLTDVEEGGGTNFPDLNGRNVTVKPKRGKALLWPSVLNSDPLKKDRRTEHQAMPVIAGQKYAANAWIHMHEYKSEYVRDCTG